MHARLVPAALSVFASARRSLPPPSSPFHRRSWVAAAVLLIPLAVTTTLQGDERLPGAARQAGNAKQAGDVKQAGDAKPPGAARQAADPSALAEEYTATVQPLVAHFCLECHSAAAREGELDLERFATLAEVRRGAEVWQQVVEMIDAGQMPPEDAAPQPTAEQRRQLLAWGKRFLRAEALTRAGDPGPVVLRRLNHAQYTYTIRDLTGVPIDPAAEFPVDGAAGEGFTNTGNSLVMSPALLAKYLEAGKEIAGHAVPLPDGFRFSASQTPRDWTNESLARIRSFYREFTEQSGGSDSAGTPGGTRVNLQGIQFETNTGGRLPIEPYLAATLAEREPLKSGEKAVADVARQYGLNVKYLDLLWTTLQDAEPSLLLDAVRARWREAGVQEAAALAAEIGVLQESLFRFSSVGHIGKAGGPTAWQEPLTPLASRQEVRLRLPATLSETGQKEVVLYLVAGDAGDGSEGDDAVWERPRIVVPGRPELLLRDVRKFTRQMSVRRQRLFAATARSLEAAEEVSRRTTASEESAASEGVEPLDVAALAAAYDVDQDSLTAWLDYLGIGSRASLDLDYFSHRLTRAGNHDFVQGWGSPDLPNLYANSSDQHVRIPGNLKPHGVVVHPTPDRHAAIGWKSPIAGTVRIEGQVTHAHPECGNGVTWSLELRRGASRQRLATGTAHGGTAVAIGPMDSFAVRPGDLLSLRIGPREANHSCDLTDVELVLTSGGDEPRQWSLTKDVAGDVLAGNPHADRFGNPDVWHFYAEPVRGGASGTVIPRGSLLARWQAAESAEEKQQLAASLQEMLVRGPATLQDGGNAEEQDPDVVLYRQLASYRGPLSLAAGAAAAEQGTAAEPSDAVAADSASSIPAGAAEERFGFDAAMFGRHPDGSAIDPASLCVAAPAVLEVRLPAELAAGAEFVTSGTLHRSAGGEGSVQFEVLLAPPKSRKHPLRLCTATPVITADGSPARKRFEAAFEDFRNLFPAALCYMEIVPVDEVVTLTLFHREDEPLRRLMLNEAQSRQLDRLWEELHFVSRDAITLVDAFEQLLEYASQDGDPADFEPLREPIERRAALFRQTLIDAEPRQLEAVVDFAARVYRRPLRDAEKERLRALYRQLREEGLSHDEAFRFTLARLFISPAFLYRLEQAPPGAEPGPVSDWELASRLSYFLWASQPDEELFAVTASGALRQPEVLAEQSQRMIRSPRIRRLATEFACQWLQIYELDALDEKSPSHFPEFEALRGDLYEEAIRFFTDVFQNDRSVLSLWDADHTFVNERLARFYGLPWDSAIANSEGERDRHQDRETNSASEWRRVEGLRQHGRGGVLGLGATLAKHSGASRSSPILRGIWVSESLLGERLPDPPPGVPPFPDNGAATANLTVRQITELHTSHADCAGCHARVDPFGFALERFDAIGRFRQRDGGGRALDTRARLPDGSEVEGLRGLRQYLLDHRRDALLHQFCRKLLGYALGRSIQLSDQPLLTEMQQQLAANDYRFSAAVSAILHSRQFQEIRGAGRVSDTAAR